MRIPNPLQSAARVPLRGPAGLCLILLLAIPWAPRAMAGECTGCAPPSANEVVTAESVTLELRQPADGWSWLPPSRDYLEMDAGNCHWQITDDTNPERINTWMVLRASGEVWNCPHSSSSATIAAHVTASDRTDWELTAKLEGSLGTAAARLGGSLSSSQGGSQGITETTDLSTTLNAAYCYRIPWLAYLQVAQYRLEPTFTLVQPWAWWTKNEYTGATVHQKGMHIQTCTSKVVVFERRAPLAWHLRRAQYGCEGCSGIPARDLGWSPQPAPGSPPPALPGDVIWPEAPTDEPLPPSDEPAPVEPLPGESVVPPGGLPPEALPWDPLPVG